VRSTKGANLRTRGHDLLAGAIRVRSQVRTLLVRNVSDIDADTESYLLQDEDGSRSAEREPSPLLYLEKV
jgi:hypothetical protein